MLNTEKTVVVISKTAYYTVNEYGDSIRVEVVGLSDATFCRPWYGLDIDSDEPKYESIDMGHSWQLIPDWTGFYEAPKCICTKQPEE